MIFVKQRENIDGLWDLLPLSICVCVFLAKVVPLSGPLDDGLEFYGLELQ